MRSDHRRTRDQVYLERNDERQTGAMDMIIKTTYVQKHISFRQIGRVTKPSKDMRKPQKQPSRDCTEMANLQTGIQCTSAFTLLQGETATTFNVPLAIIISLLASVSRDEPPPSCCCVYLCSFTTWHVSSIWQRRMKFRSYLHKN